MMYLQRAGKGDTINVWEEVDKYTWDNWEKAVDKNNSQRYNGNRVMKFGSNILLHCEDVSSRDLAIITRFLDIKQQEAPGSVVGGFVQKPEFVRFRGRNNKMVLHEVGGSDYVCRQKATGEPVEAVEEK